jgi:tetraacyldisaccharide 4'-kinase
VLDDGFQHLALARDIDLLIVTEADLSDRTLPSGRLREPIDTLAAADAVLVREKGEKVSGTVSGPECPAETVPDTFFRVAALGARHVFRLTQTTGDAWLLETREAAADAGFRRVAVVAGIARPARVADSARAAGWMVVDTFVFPDHHPYSRADVNGVVMRARAAGAEAVLTTAKDAVRLAPHCPVGLPLAVLPITVSVEPAGEFESWLRGRLAEARLGGRSAIGAEAPR